MPWAPGLLSDRSRGVQPIPPPEVRRLRVTVAELLDAKLPVDTAHREGEDLTTRQLNRLLTAIEKHAALVNRLLRSETCAGPERRSSRSRSYVALQCTIELYYVA